MNIGIILDNDLNNDARVIRQLEILKKNHNIFVLCYGYLGKSYKNIEGLRIERINIPIFFKNILFFLFNFFPLYEFLWSHKISKFIAKNSIKVIHCHDLYMSKCVYQANKKNKFICKVILDLHENYPEVIKTYNWTKGYLRKLIVRPNIWKKKEKEYLKYADKIIVLSDDFKNNLLRKYSFLQEKNIISYPNVIDFNRFNNFQIDKKFKRSKLITLFYYGVVAERRGIFNALLSVEKIIKLGYNIKFLIIGPVDKADKSRFFHLINSNHLKKHIEYIPWIEIEKLPTYLYISYICIAPFLINKQHESGIANKIFQYMYGKKPIIASNCKPQAKIINNFKCGLIYNNKEDLIQKIIFLINNPDLIKKMGQNGYNNLHKFYNNDNLSNDLLNFYN